MEKIRKIIQDASDFFEGRNKTKEQQEKTKSVIANPENNTHEIINTSRHKYQETTSNEIFLKDIISESDKSETGKDNSNNLPSKDVWVPPQQLVWKFLNGKKLDGQDCLGCKIVAVGAPLTLSIIFLKQYRGVDWTSVHLTRMRLAYKTVHFSLIFGMAWLALMSAASAWLEPKDGETLTDYFTRDLENQREIGKKLLAYFSSKDK